MQERHGNEKGLQNDKEVGTALVSETKRAGAVQHGEEKAQGTSHQCYKYVYIKM